MPLNSTQKKSVFFSSKEINCTAVKQEHISLGSPSIEDVETGKKKKRKVSVSVFVDYRHRCSPGFSKKDNLVKGCGPCKGEVSCYFVRAHLLLLTITTRK